MAEQWQEERAARRKALSARMRAELARLTTAPPRDVRCAGCGRFQFQAAGVGMAMTFPCSRCYRLVVVDAAGRVTAVSLDVEGERRTA